MTKSKSRKGRNRRKIKISHHQQRKKTARKENTHTSGSQGARGGCSAETKYRNNRITEYSTKESRKAKIKAKTIQETNGKRQETKTNKKGTRKGKGNTENDKKERKKKKEKRKRKKYISYCDMQTSNASNMQYTRDGRKQGVGPDYFNLESYKLSLIHI